MNGLFSNLLVSSPNGGGLFFIHDKLPKKLDSFNTVGLFAAPRKFLRAIQPESVWAFGDNPLQIHSDAVALGDVHDVLEFEGHLYVVGTTGNEVIKLDSQGTECQRWRFPGEDDSRHVNCLGIWNGRIVYSAFGEFSQHRGYKGLSEGQGFVNDLMTGRRLISGLSQPHTPMPNGENLLLANSERSELHEYAPNGDLLRKKTLPGYTRGISVTEDAIYVGMSKSRNIDVEGLSSAVLLALDPDTWEELGRVAIPASEVYSVISIADDAEMLWTVTQVASYVSEQMEDRIARMQEVATEQSVEAMRRREFVDAISQQLTGRLQPYLEYDRHDSTETDEHLKAVIRAQSLPRFFEDQTVDDELAALTKANVMLGAAFEVDNAHGASYLEHIRHLKGKMQDFEKCKERVLELEGLCEQFSLREVEDKGRLMHLERQMQDFEKCKEHVLELEELCQQSSLREADDKDRLLHLEQMVEIFRNPEMPDAQRLVNLEEMINASDVSGRASLERLVELEALLVSLTLKEIASRERAQFESDAHRTSFELVRNSRTWRWTEPVRKANANMSQVKRRIIDDLYKIYRRLPMTAHNKQKLKGVIFRYLGFALKDLSAYKVWKDYQGLSINWPTTQSRAIDADPLPSVSPQPHAELPMADGVWEWRDYPEVRARISQIKASERAKFQPEPINILDLKQSSFAQTAANLSFADPGPEPHVSIIIPVFNNVKLTLECLLSIQQKMPADISVEIIVADDASTDDTQALLAPVANIKYLRSEQNAGFLLNCNQAMAQVSGSYTVYLNNDVQVTSGWLEALLSTFEEFENVGAVGPKFVYPTGHLQEAGASLASDGTSTMIGLNDNPADPRFNYTRRVDYVSGACLLASTELLKRVGGFSEDFLPCYCEDSDLCLSIRGLGYDIYYNPAATIIHHLSKTTAATDETFKMACIAKNVSVLNNKWASTIEKKIDPRIITFFLPQFHPVLENDLWWGKGFTEWTNVSKARPNFLGHYQPRIPADHGYYDLRLNEVLQAQADLAQRYGVHGFCFYYYWFDGKRLLERPVEQLLLNDKPDIPFCLCWANENWTRRWDGQEHEVLMAQAHTEEDDVAVIYDLIRFFKDDRYIKIDDRPLILIYRATLFPDFAKTAERWRKVCREQGLGEIYIAMVESFELVQANTHPSTFGCDAAVEFPPQGLAEVKPPSGEVINPEFVGSVADYRDLAVRYATRPAPGYTRFKGVIPGWDNTARRQHTSFCFENASPGAFQAWLEESIDDTKEQNFGDERLVFVNAWNEWAEGAYLEPDRRYGHTYLEAVSNAMDASRLLKKN